MIVYRPQRGSLDDAMKEIASFNSLTELARHVLDHDLIRSRFSLKDIQLEYYGDADDRIDWKETWLVVINGFGAVGYITHDDDPEAVERMRSALDLFKNRFLMAGR